MSGLESRISILVVSEKEQLAWEFDDLVTLTFKQIDGDGSEHSTGLRSGAHSICSD